LPDGAQRALMGHVPARHSAPHVRPRPARGVGDKRNRAVHDSWNWNKETGQSYRLQISAQKRLVLGPQPMGTEELDALIDTISEHIDAFEKIVTEVERQVGVTAGICFLSSKAS
jgi:hypothetical protein